VLAVLLTCGSQAVIQTQEGRKFDQQEVEDPFFRFGNVGELPVTQSSFFETNEFTTEDFFGSQADDQSQKGRKFDQQEVEDPFFSVTQSSLGENVDAGGGGIDTTWPEDDDWAEDTWDTDDWPEWPSETDPLPPCSELSQSDLEFGVACNNGTVVEEIRLRDSLFERLFRQLWSDTQTKMNEDAAVNGMVIDPLDVDAQLPEPIEEHHSSGLYTIDIKMSRMKVYGLSGINLTETEVTRSENLTDFDMRLTFSFDELVINGTYNLQGNINFVGPIDSHGTKPFEISIKEASVTNRMKLELVDPESSWNVRACSDESFIFDDPNVLITEIEMPLAYKDVNFRFEGLGAFANNMINGVGIYMLQTQEATIKEEIRKNIKMNVNSLIC